MSDAKEIWNELDEAVSWDELSKEQQLGFAGLVHDGGDETPKGLKVRDLLNPVAVVEEIEELETVTEIPTVESLVKNNTKEELVKWAKSLKIKVTADNNEEEIAQKIVAKLNK